MGKSAKKRQGLQKANPESEQDPKFDTAIIILSSDDDADEDLSLKIVGKSMLRASGNNPSSSVTELKKKVKKTKDKKMKKKAKGAQVHGLENTETKEEDGAPKGSDATIEPGPSEKPDNIVLRKLLRGPRYFDPPDDSWKNCYNCGVSGYTTANCTSGKRKKPCFVCGSLEHHVKQCNKQGKDCFICKKGGHRAKHCPEKSNWGSQSTKICLNCGDSGHEMFSCKNNYSSDDLKEVQCYVCKCFGHLCCVNYAGEGSREVSCYRCGQLGHFGRECARVHAETASKWTPSCCYMCGEEAHTVCRCTANSKKEKRKRDSSTPKKKKKQKKKKSTGKYGNYLGARSMPQLNPTGRDGWINENPSAYNHNHNHNHGWGSSMTPPMYVSNDRFQFHGYTLGYNSSGFHINPGMFHTPGSNGYQHISRFGNSCNYGRREYGWGS